MKLSWLHVCSIVIVCGAGAVVRVNEVKVKSSALALGNWDQGVLLAAVLASGIHFVLAALALFTGFEWNAKNSVAVFVGKLIELTELGIRHSTQVLSRHRDHCQWGPWLERTPRQTQNHVAWRVSC